MLASRLLALTCFCAVNVYSQSTTEQRIISDLVAGFSVAGLPSVDLRTFVTAGSEMSLKVTPPAFTIIDPSATITFEDISSTTWSDLGSSPSTTIISTTTTIATVIDTATTVTGNLQSNPISTENFLAPTIAANHFVDVGAYGGFLFNPTQVDASVGDIIMFRFLELNHTVTQSTLESPCFPSGGFDSGFSYYNPLNQTGVINQLLPFLVRDTEPAWFFCRQTNPQSHCSAGMVFGVNAGAHIDEFILNAESSFASTGFVPRNTKTAFSGMRYWNTSTALNLPTGYGTSGFGATGVSSTGTLSMPTAGLSPVSTVGFSSEGTYVAGDLRLIFLYMALILIHCFTVVFHA